MFQTVTRMQFADIDDVFPVFVMLVLIPLTFSITQGILWGFVLHVGLYAAVRRWREVPPALSMLAAVSAGLLFLEQ
jgi:AGZA family xanthine/uracil permease-like MFS transporter